MEILKDTIAGLTAVTPPPPPSKQGPITLFSMLKVVLPQAPLSVTELDQFLALHMIPSDQCPFAWWKANANLFPTLSKLAKRYFAIQATSVETERLFSIAGHVVSRRRTRLSMRTVHYLVSLRSWSDITSYNAAQPAVEVPDEEIESDGVAWEYDTEGVASDDDQEF
jgi:hypothetical protein